MDLRTGSTRLRHHLWRIAVVDPLELQASKFTIDTMSIDAIQADFEVLDEWEDRYRYVIELGRELAPLDDAEKTDATKVRGCASQVWLVTDNAASNDPSNPVMTFRGESDAHIVQGLIAILLAIYNGKTAREITELDAHAIFAGLGLNDHLTPQRSNGLKSMIERIRAEAASAIAS